MHHSCIESPNSQFTQKCLEQLLYGYEILFDDVHYWLGKKSMNWLSGASPVVRRMVIYELFVVIQILFWKSTVMEPRCYVNHCYLCDLIHGDIGSDNYRQAGTWVFEIKSILPGMELRTIKGIYVSIV